MYEIKQDVEKFFAQITRMVMGALNVEDSVRYVPSSKIMGKKEKLVQVCLECSKLSSS